jgi:DNA-binding XRE family transcriptional regulator
MKSQLLSEQELEALYKTIGNNVKKYREDAGLTQMDLAHSIGHKSVGTVSFCEIYLNKKHFNIKQLANIAKVLDLNIADFFEPSILQEKT